MAYNIKSNIALIFTIFYLTAIAIAILSIISNIKALLNKNPSFAERISFIAYPFLFILSWAILLNERGVFKLPNSAIQKIYAQKIQEL